MVEERVSTFIKSLDPLTANTKQQHTISIFFTERRAKKNNYWFGKAEEEVCWEQWLISLTLTQARTEREQLEAKKAVETQLLTALSKITQKANENKDHVPPITNTDSYPFPFQIVFSTIPDASSWGDLLKGLINHSGPSVLGM
ncbi:hypothetical protein HDU76_013137 [Blyttiomyces sp. JEL0837]|nr:hypothetical protein HDU76_013137 [Blyttiomyces sp. JEL0837]